MDLYVKIPPLFIYEVYFQKGMIAFATKSGTDIWSGSWTI